MSSSSSPASLAVPGKTRTRITVSDVDADGVVAIGPLTIIRYLDIGGHINLHSLHLEPLSPHLTSVLPEEKDDLVGYSRVKIGASYGLPVYLITNMSAADLTVCFYQFLAKAAAPMVGVQNGWLVTGNSTPQDVRNRCVAMSRWTVQITPSFLVAMARDLRWRLTFLGHADTVEVKACLMQFGMRTPVRDFNQQIGMALNLESVVKLDFI